MLSLKFLNQSLNITRKSACGEPHEAHILQHNLSREGGGRGWGHSPGKGGTPVLSYGSPPPEGTWNQRPGYALEGTWDQILGYPLGKELGPVSGKGLETWLRYCPLPPPPAVVNRLKTLPYPSFGCGGKNYKWLLVSLSVNRYRLNGFWRTGTNCLINSENMITKSCFFFKP